MNEKLLQANEIREILRNTWPILNRPNRILIFDLVHESLTLELAKEYILTTHVEELKMIPNIMECEDFALILHAEIKKLHVAKGKYSLAFGRAVGNRFRGLPGKHQLNIFISDEKKIYFIEPQTDDIWEADSFYDDVFFVEL
jgi:hypothetical protein